MSQVNPKEETITLTQYKDLVTQITKVQGNVERIDSHFKKHNETLDEFAKIQVKQNKILDEVHQFLKGNEYSDGEGLVTQFKSMKSKIETLSENQIRYNVYFALLGTGLIVTSSAIITLVVKVFIGQ